MKSFLSILLAVICVLGMTACSNDPDTNKASGEVSQSQLQEANSTCINVDTHDIVMQSDTEGTVEMTIQIPDYKALYKEAYSSGSPDEYLLNALQTGKYDICERTVIARVTVENGERVIHTEAAVKGLLERELSDAINALMEAE